MAGRGGGLGKESDALVYGVCTGILLRWLRVPVPEGMPIATSLFCQLSVEDNPELETKATCYS